MELIVAVVHNDKHIQVGFDVSLAPSARAVEDDAKNPIAEASPQAIKILAQRRPFTRMKLRQFFYFHDALRSCAGTPAIIKPICSTLA